MKIIFLVICMSCANTFAKNPSEIWLENYKTQQLVQFSEITKGPVLFVVAQERCDACDEQIETLIKNPSAEFTTKLLWFSETEKPKKSWVQKILIFKVVS